MAGAMAAVARSSATSVGGSLNRQSLGRVVVAAGSSRSARRLPVSSPVETRWRLQSGELAGAVRHQWGYRRRASVEPAGTQPGAFRLRTAASAAGPVDKLVRLMAENAEVSVVAIVGTSLVREAADRHKTAPTSTAAMGRALMGTLLLASFQGPEETVQISFRGNGPAGQLMTIGDTLGNVKGTMQNPKADPPLRPDGKLNVGRAVGKGILSVVRSHPQWKEPYTGMIPISSGEVAEDIATYLADSEQVNSAVGLGVTINRHGLVDTAGGYMVQVLPFASEETLVALEQALTGMPSPSELVAQGLGAEDIARKILGPLGPGTLVVEMDPKYGICGSANLKERMARALATLPPAELKSILEERGNIEVRCEFCQESLTFSEEDVAALPSSK